MPPTRAVLEENSVVSRALDPTPNSVARLEHRHLNLATTSSEEPV